MRIKGLQLVFCFWSILYRVLYAQNLIPDSSFEKNNTVPVEYSAIGANAYWKSPTRGTPDLFCRCKNKKLAKISVVNVPSNAMGIQEPKSGNCYAGLFCVSHGYYREYLQTELSAPLEAGKEYVVRFYISLSDYSTLTADKIGICLLNQPLRQEHSDYIRNLNPVYIPLDPDPGTDTEQWHEKSFLYKARGGEKYLLLGTFELRKLRLTGREVPKNLSTPIYKKEPRDAYYYFDDVSITEYKPEPEEKEFSEISSEDLATNDPPEVVTVGPASEPFLHTDSVMVFKNLLFKTGKWEIEKSSFSELDLLAKKMNEDKTLKIEIYGHTDKKGNELKNKQLSENRAKAVAEYLMEKGIENYRIVYVGFGSSRPVADNLSEEGRKQNRRVEFVLYRQN
ncbi:MAG: OmpA family protein [Bacteroidia bacterium]|nr:OmpA family protein [Bacteroidia bacterium]